MKICHCVKLTNEEIRAFDTVRAILDTMDRDAMLASNFDEGVSFCDISSWLDDVMDFIQQLNN